MVLAFVPLWDLVVISAAESSYVSRLHYSGMKVQFFSFLLVHWERPARGMDQKKVAAYSLVWLVQWNSLVVIMKSLSQKQIQLITSDVCLATLLISAKTLICLLMNRSLLISKYWFCKVC